MQVYGGHAEAKATGASAARAGQGGQSTAEDDARRDNGSTGVRQERPGTLQTTVLVTGSNGRRTLGITHLSYVLTITHYHTSNG